MSKSTKICTGSMCLFFPMCLNFPDPEAPCAWYSYAYKNECNSCLDTNKQLQQKDYEVIS